MASKRELEIESRLTAMEVGFNAFRTEVRAEFKELKENHIAHLDAKMWWGVTLAMTILLGLVTDLVLRLWK